MLIIAGTGHRPEDTEGEFIVREKVRSALLERRAGVFISGMAAGYDLWSADEARLLGLEVWAARPWAGHKPRNEDTELYDTIIEYASRVVNVTDSEEYTGPWVYHKRNEWMIDHATHVLAYLNPEKNRGGTFACVAYAKKMGVPVRNIYG